MTTGDRQATSEPSPLVYTGRRIARHLRWLRTEGPRRLIEEDRLNPWSRATAGWARHRWRRTHPRPPGQSIPVYVVGLQRSGTNMLVRGLEGAPEFEVRNENDRRVFHRFRLRPDPVLVAALRASRQAYVLVKPLCESHRVDELLDLAGPVPGRAVWVWRDVDDRARSEVAKFGPSNLDALRATAAGTIGDGWQAQRLGTAARELIAGFDYDTMTPHTGAALFWYLRNSLYFDLALDRRPDVLLSSYDRLVAEPAATTARLCDFLGLAYDPRLCAHVESRSRPRRPLDIDPRVRALCDDLTRRLAAIHG